MLSKNILVDSAIIGTIQFYAYVFNDRDDRVGFGLFPNDGPFPIVYLVNLQGSKTRLFFNEEIILKICRESKFNTSERRVLFREFMDYVGRMEKRASKLIFRDAKMSYVSDSREMVKYKRLYIHYKEPNPNFLVENNPTLSL